MRTLYLAVFLSLLPVQLWAAEALPQPDEQDWKSLGATTLALKERYTQLVERATERVNTLPGEIAQRPESANDLKRALANNTAVLARGKQVLNGLRGVLTELNGLTMTTRTREKYLQLRRQVKEWQVQWTVDERFRYGVYDDGSRRFTAKGLEERLAALKTNPPETVPVKPRLQGLTLDWQTLPRLDGSTTAQPLTTLIVCRALGLGAIWQYRRIYDPSESKESPERVLVPQCAGSPLPVTNGGFGYYDSSEAMLPGLKLSMTLTGTNSAYQNLILGASDFIIVARPPSADETKLAKDKGVELESRAIAYDAFIFLLNRANPVNSLTVPQLQAIYQDNVLRWSEVGGNQEKMIAFQRERNSGSQETMQALVMKGLPMAPSVEQLLEQGMGGPYNRLPGTPNGIGYTFYYYHTVQSPVNRTARFVVDGKELLPPIKVCAVNGVMPTAETIRNRTYPFVTEVYAVIRKAATPDSPAVRLRDWLLTPEGQALVQESGYVPLPR